MVSKEQGWKDCPYRESSKICRFGTKVCVEELPTERQEKLRAINAQVEKCLQQYMLGRTLFGVGVTHKFVQEED